MLHHLLKKNFNCHTGRTRKPQKKVCHQASPSGGFSSRVVSLRMRVNSSVKISTSRCKLSQVAVTTIVLSLCLSIDADACPFLTDTGRASGMRWRSIIDISRLAKLGGTACIVCTYTFLCARLSLWLVRVKPLWLLQLIANRALVIIAATHSPL